MLNSNVNCLKSLITKGLANVNKRYTHTRTYINGHALEIKSWAPLMEAIQLLSLRPGHFSDVIMHDIFDVLLDAAVEHNTDHLRSCTTYKTCALAYRNVYSVKKLMNVGAPLDTIGYGDLQVWDLIAHMGNIELLESMSNHGIVTDFVSSSEPSYSLLWHVVMSHEVEAVRHLLAQGVTIPDYSQNVRQVQCEQCEQCEQCKESRLIIPDWEGHDPCIKAICSNQLENTHFLT